MKRTTWIFIAVLGGLLFFGGLTCSRGYNSLVGLDEAVDAQWGQVENVYQRRADLIPNLVETVKAAAKFEKDTVTAVAEARSRAGQVRIGNEITQSPEAFEKFQRAQDDLSSALSRLLVVSEAYPDLKATAGFRDLQAQLEGAENRIAVERMRYNEVARDFNQARNRFPAVLYAGFFGDRFAAKQYFRAKSGADTAPTVKF